MRVRLAQHILNCLATDDFAMLFSWGFTGPDILYPASAELVNRRARRIGGHDKGLAETEKGQWNFFAAYKEGWFWNRKKSVRIMKYDGTELKTVQTFTQDEKDALYDAWQQYVLPAIEAEKARAKEFMLKTMDGDAWYP